MPAKTPGAPRTLRVPLRGRTLPAWASAALAVTTVLAVAVLVYARPQPVPPPERIPVVVSTPTIAPSAYRA